MEEKPQQGMETYCIIFLERPLKESTSKIQNTYSQYFNDVMFKIKGNPIQKLM